MGSLPGWVEGACSGQASWCQFLLTAEMLLFRCQNTQCLSCPWEGVRNGKIISSLSVSSRAEVEAVSVLPLAEGGVSAVQSQPEQPAGKSAPGRSISLSLQLTTTSSADGLRARGLWQPRGSEGGEAIRSLCLALTRV